LSYISVADIIGLSSATLTLLATKASELGKIMRNKGHYAVQCHSRSPISVPIENPYATSY